MYDVVVVGAGPAGSAAAHACAEKGLATLCIEEHGTIGYPVQCAGLLSVAAWKECRVSQKSILHEVQGARFFASGGEAYTLDTGNTRAMVVDRGILDREMATKAQDAGAEYKLKTMARGISGTTLITTGLRGKEEVHAPLIIAADGVRSGVARSLGFTRPPVLLSGLQAEIQHEMDPRFVEVHPHASTEFFGWVIPAGKGRARVGLCGERDVQERFSRFIKRYPGPCIHLVSGAIPLGVMPCTFGKGVLFIGDAAGMVKPTSGGGIFTGVRSAHHAADTAAECHEAGRFDDRALSAYERRWKADIGRDLSTGFRLFRLRRTLSSADVDRLLSLLGDPSVLETIRTEGDMDRPRRLILQLAKKPALYPLLGSLLGKKFGEILK
ncbi:MAG: NAD(P)/FAD-dependent oxidoreductase [Methanomicrobiales archaeon]|nr:NAD(P)/FAD-dependent oxidoreductase [Methanomicrobiales archaeon]